MMPTAYLQSKAYQVVVAGLGCAGASAALAAADRGRKVLILDRFAGGGTSAASGGLVYSGGGTDVQKRLGFGNDTPEDMFRYLSMETDGCVSDSTLRRFCETSVERFDWLNKTLKIPFDGDFHSSKVSYPGDSASLFYTGNEKIPTIVAQSGAKPAPRGHRPTGGKFMTGNVLMKHMVQACENHENIDIMPFSRVVSLRVGNRPGNSAVVGVNASQLQTTRWVKLLSNFVANNAGFLSKSLQKRIQEIVTQLEEKHEKKTPLAIGCDSVVLATGGFAFNDEMMSQYAPKYRHTLPLGTLGDDGSGIRMAMEVGASVGQMENCSAWNFIYPPESMTLGMLVGDDGKRIGHETYYGATVSDVQVKQHNSSGILIIDQNLYKKCQKEIAAEDISMWLKLAYFAKWNGYVKAACLEELGLKLNFHPGFVKEAKNFQQEVKGEGGIFQLKDPPFYALKVPVDDMTPCLTLGGLRVDEKTGQVLSSENNNGDGDGRGIDGLFAAGRTAVGVTSSGYVSGLSLADAVFSGLRAGNNA